MPPVVYTITQNIGALDGGNLSDEVDPRTVRRTNLFWQSFAEWIKECSADVVVMHVQEIGGKRYHSLFQELFDSTSRSALPSDEYWCSGLLMFADVGAGFTALGTLIWVRSTLLSRTKIYNYAMGAYVALPAQIPLTLSTTQFGLSHKLSEAEKSRKGVFFTHLLIGERKMFFTNIHLYHDVDNLGAIHKSPSVYAEKRVRGLVESIQVLLTKGGASLSDSIYVFGDFNTRLDGLGFVQESNTGDTEKVRIEPKFIHMPPELWAQFSTPSAWPALRKYDKEGQVMMDAVAKTHKVHLCELPREFGPSYSIVNEEGLPECGSYKDERLPAWCDHVFVNTVGLAAVSEFQYWICPLHILDHRGVYLMFTLLE